MDASLISTTQMTATAPGSGAADPKHIAALHTAQEFESLFLAQFAQTLFSGISSEGPFGGGPAEDIYKNLLAEEYGKSLANAGGIGLADSVYREIIKTQEVA